MNAYNKFWAALPAPFELSQFPDRERILQSSRIRRECERILACKNDMSQEDRALFLKSCREAASVKDLEAISAKIYVGGEVLLPEPVGEVAKADEVKTDKPKRRIRK